MGHRGNSFHQLNPLTANAVGSREPKVCVGTGSWGGGQIPPHGCSLPSPRFKDSSNTEHQKSNTDPFTLSISVLGPLPSPLCALFYFILRIMCFFLILFIYFYREGEGGRERGKQWVVASHAPPTWPTTQACAPTGNQTDNPLVHRLAPNPLSHTSQGQNYLFLCPFYRRRN